MKRIQIAAIFVLLFPALAWSTVNYRVSSITGPDVVAIGGVQSFQSWSLEGLSSTGQTLSIASGPHSGRVGQSSVSGYSLSLAPLTTPGLGGIVAVNGQALNDFRIEGAFEISHATVFSPVNVTPDPSMPGTFLPISGSVNDVPVEYVLSYEIFDSSTATEAAHRISAAGTGTGDFLFSSLPSDFNVVGTQRLTYTLDAPVPASVPEPHSAAVWILLLTCVGFAKRVLGTTSLR